MIIERSDATQWEAIVSAFPVHDIYHLPCYHAVAERTGEGEPCLFYSEIGEHRVALPFLLRGIEGESVRKDATSVYGYPGLLASVKETDFRSVRRIFQDTLRRDLEGLGAISLFVRQNPLIPTTALFQGLGEIVRHGETVAIDLSRDETAQAREIRKGHRFDIRKARQLGMSTYEDIEFGCLDRFISIYRQTMERQGAGAYYLFDEFYFHALKERLGKKLKLIFSKLNGVLTSASLFTLTGGIIQYHLSGTANGCLQYPAGSKLILDEMRRWGTKHGYRWFHLGGGVGARKDSLFSFKSGFSKLTFPFDTVRVIIDESSYNELSAKRSRTLANEGREIDNDFFPTYRHR